MNAIKFKFWEFENYDLFMKEAIKLISEIKFYFDWFKKYLKWITWRDKSVFQIIVVQRR